MYFRRKNPLIRRFIAVLLPAQIVMAFSASFRYPAVVPVGEEGLRIIRAVSIDSTIHIDGRLDEPAWSRVSFQGHFIQREPHLGEPVSERTQVALLQDRRNLYIGIKCYDSDPDRIIARDMRRDAEIDNEDYCRCYR